MSGLNAPDYRAQGGVSIAVQTNTPSTGRMFGTALAQAGTEIGTAFLFGGLNRALGGTSALQGDAQPTQAEIQAQQQAQLQNQIVGFARNMDATQIQAKIDSITQDISKNTEDLAQQQELAAGDKSSTYIDNESKIKDMETQYGFGADTPDGKATKEAKDGDAYQKAADAYNAIVKQDETYNSNKIRIDTRLETIGGTDKGEIKNITDSINAKDKEIKELGQEVSIDSNDTPADKQAKEIKNKNIRDQKAFKTIELNNLKQQETKLKQEKIALEAEQKNNEAKKVKDDAIVTAKKKMDDAANPKGSSNDYSALYAQYNQLKEDNRKIKAAKPQAEMKVQELTLQIKSLNIEKAKYENALEIKGQMTNDDTKAGASYNDVSGKNDGNWWSRHMPRFLGGAKKATRDAYNQNRTEGNNYINTYMVEHGVTRKQAIAAIKALSPT